MSSLSPVVDDNNNNGTNSGNNNNLGGGDSPSSTNIINDSEWDIHSRCVLLESIGKYLPLGINKYFSLLNCSILMKEQLPHKHFTSKQIFNEIQEYYNLDELDDDIIDEDEPEIFELPDEFKSLVEDKLHKSSVTTKKLKT
eukprot:gene1567-1986_t